MEAQGTSPSSADLSGANRRRGWWERRPFLAILILVATIPLLYPAVPPLVDLIGHMGRYRVQIDLAQSAELQRYFDFHWQLIGNLGVDILVQLLAPFVGLETAVKLIAMSIPPLTVAGFLWVAREVHHRLPPTVAFALPFAFSHPFMFGFLNYTLSMALAFLAFGLWLRLARLGKLRLRALLFVPISFALFICHTFGWGTLGLLCFSAEAVRLHDKGESWWKAGIHAAFHAAVMAGPLLLLLLWRSDVTRAGSSGWFDWDMKLIWLTSALRDRWQVIDMGLMVAVGLVVGCAILSRWLTFSRNLAFSAIVLTVAFLILPWTVFGSAYADMRLLPYAVAVLVLAIRFSGETRWRLANGLAVLAVTAYAIKVAATTASLAIAANAQERQLVALDHVPIGARMVNFVGQPCVQTWPLFRKSHLGAMAIVRRHAFSNDQWAVEGANLLSVRFDAARPFRADPSQMVRTDDCIGRRTRAVDDALARVPREAIDYVWLIQTPRHDPRSLAGYHRIWEGDGSALYASDSRVGKRAP